MKKLISNLLVLAITLQATAQTATSWFKSFTGTAGKTSFTILLHRAGIDYTAYVYDEHTQQPYQLAGQNPNARMIVLTGVQPGSNYDEKWILKFTGKKITGTCVRNKIAVTLVAEERGFEPNARFVYTRHSEKLNNEKSAPAATFYQSGIWYEGNSGINKLLWPNCISQTAVQYFVANKNDFITSFKDEHRDLKPADYTGMQSVYNRDTHAELLMSYVSQNLLVFSAHSYTFGGGAHGNFGTGHLVVDRRNNKLLSLKDIIPDTALLIPLLEINFRRIYGIEKNIPLTDAGLFQNTIPVTDNFILTQKSLGFTYNPYEIGPYAMGQITIYIPLEECGSLISESAKNIFTNTN